MAPWAKAQAEAQSVKVVHSAATVAEDCSGGDAVIDGSADNVSLRNTCRSLVVNGSGNDIQIELQSGGSIALNGSGNHIAYTPVGGAHDARVTDKGQANEVVRGAASKALPPGSSTPGSLMINGVDGKVIQIQPSDLTAAAPPPATSASPATPGERGTATAPAPPPTVAMATPAQSSGGNPAAPPPATSQRPVTPDQQGTVAAPTLPPAVAMTTPAQGSGNKPAPPPANGQTNQSNGISPKIGATVETHIELPPIAPASSVPASVSRAPAPPSEPVTNAAEQKAVQQLRRELGAVQTPQGTLVRLPCDVLFDRDRLRPDAEQSLTELAELIAHLHPSGLHVTGYTDTFGTPQYNLDISTRRAHRVADWLQKQGHVQVAALQVAGRGEDDPVAPNDLPNGKDNLPGRHQNRRVEVLLLSPQHQ